MGQTVQGCMNPMLPDMTNDLNDQNVLGSDAMSVRQRSVRIA